MTLRWGNHLKHGGATAARGHAGVSARIKVGARLLRGCRSATSHLYSVPRPAGAIGRKDPRHDLKTCSLSQPDGRFGEAQEWRAEADHARRNDSGANRAA